MICPPEFFLFYSPIIGWETLANESQQIRWISRKFGGFRCHWWTIDFIAPDIPQAKLPSLQRKRHCLQWMALENSVRRKGFWPFGLNLGVALGHPEKKCSDGREPTEWRDVDLVRIQWGIRGTWISPIQKLGMEKHCLLSNPRQIDFSAWGEWIDDGPLFTKIVIWKSTPRVI
jgi:hypothetical protein